MDGRRPAGRLHTPVACSTCRLSRHHLTFKTLKKPLLQSAWHGALNKRLFAALSSSSRPVQALLLNVPIYISLIATTCVAETKFKFACARYAITNLYIVCRQLRIFPFDMPTVMVVAAACNTAMAISTLYASCMQPSHFM